MKIGQRAGFPVVPVTIDGSLHVNHRDRFAACPGPVRLVFHDPIPAEEAGAMSAAELHDRVVETIAHELGQPSCPSAAEPMNCVATEAST
jgi:1-acyl-sn-glycerol-3-phosphate acyltransferase